MTFYLLGKCGHFGITLWPFSFVAVLDVNRGHTHTHTQLQTPLLTRPTHRLLLPGT